MKRMTRVERMEAIRNQLRADIETICGREHRAALTGQDVDLDGDRTRLIGELNKIQELIEKAIEDLRL